MCQEAAQWCCTGTVRERHGQEGLGLHAELLLQMCDVGVVPPVPLRHGRMKPMVLEELRYAVVEMTVGHAQMRPVA